jgi:hypothetical protein
MTSERRVLEIDLRRRKPSARYDALLETLGSSASAHLDRLVEKALSHFEGGSNPNEVYRDFDIDGLAQIIAIDRRSAAEALSAFRDRPGEEKIAACMFVSMALIVINGTDPHLARLALGHITRKASQDSGFSDLSKIVLIGIAQTIYGMEEAADAGLISLANCCIRRINE